MRESCTQGLFTDGVAAGVSLQRGAWVEGERLRESAAAPRPAFIRHSSTSQHPKFSTLNAQPCILNPQPQPWTTALKIFTPHPHSKAVPLFRCSSRFESSIVSHHFRLTFECDEEEIDDDDEVHPRNHFTEICIGSEEESYARLIDFCITHL